MYIYMYIYIRLFVKLTLNHIFLRNKRQNQWCLSYTFSKIYQVTKSFYFSRNDFWNWLTWELHIFCYYVSVYPIIVSAQLSSTQSLSRVWFFATSWITAHEASMFITNTQSSLRLISIESVMPSNHFILCHPLLLPSIFPIIRIFSNESALCIRWPKYWSFSFSISPSNEHAGLISFRMDWLDLLAIQGTLRSLLQHHSSKASILQHSVFLIVQLSHPYITTGKKNSLD